MVKGIDLQTVDQTYSLLSGRFDEASGVTNQILVAAVVDRIPVLDLIVFSAQTSGTGDTSFATSGTAIGPVLYDLTSFSLKEIQLEGNIGEDITITTTHPAQNAAYWKYHYV